MVDSDVQPQPGDRPGDRDEIDIDDPAQVRAWSRRIGCTEDQLRAAVRSVGTNSMGVEAYLRAKDNPRRRSLDS